MKLMVLAVALCSLCPSLFAQRNVYEAAFEEATASLDLETRGDSSAPESDYGDDVLPSNPNAYDHCRAKVIVSSAHLRSSPSLKAEIRGTLVLNDTLFVQKVRGKWAQLSMDKGETVFIAAYLLEFSWQDLLEQWKKDAPQPTVGKKPKVKWASGRPLPMAFQPEVNAEPQGIAGRVF